MQPPLLVSSFPLSTRCIVPLRMRIWPKSQHMRAFSHKTPCRTCLPIKPAVGVLGAAVGAATVYFLFLRPDESRSAPTLLDAFLSPAHFTPATITASQPCADPDARLLTLTVPKTALPPQNNSIFSSIWSIFIKDDDIQVERPYTPLEGIDHDGRMKFWIKRYPKGEVARWLHSKNVGDHIEIRGPLKTWPWREGTWDEVVMISGGTGIAPFHQLLHEVLLGNSSAGPNTRFTLVHSSRTPNELPPSAMLERLLFVAKQSPERLKVIIHVDSVDGPAHPLLRATDFKLGRIDKTAIVHALGLDNNAGGWWQYFRRGIERKPSAQTQKVLFLVCGPQPMIDAIAGQPGRNYSQGTVGGVLGEMGYNSDQVYKLI